MLNVRRSASLCALLLWMAGSPAVHAADPAAARHRAAGDAAWSARAEGAPADDPGRAAPGPIGRAISAYEAAVAADPDDLEARWKLLRALYFQGEYVARGDDARREVFDRGRQAAEAALGRLSGRAGRVPEAAAIHFWTAVHWGLWGDAFGRLAAARQGVAGKIRDHAEAALSLDPTLENAGPRRVLGRLHALAPKIPFFTGWIDRDVAIAELERAVAEGPAEPLNRLYLAEALLEHAPDRRAEALRHLRDLLRRPADPERRVEEASARHGARAILRRENGG